MRKQLLAVVCAVSGLVFVWTGIGQTQEFKVAFVDLQKFGTKSVKAKAMEKKFMDLVKAKQRALEDKKKELTNLQEQLQKQGPMLQEAVRNQKIKEVGIKEMELKLAQKEAENSVKNEQRDMMAHFQRDLTKIIGRIRAQKGLKLVFNQTALLSADDSLDLTDEVAKAYDAEATTSRPPAAARPVRPRTRVPAAGPARRAAPK
jgi:Skp family chaperone for outer membrane proteins